MPSRGRADSAISKFLRNPPDSTGGETVAALSQACPLCAAPMVMLIAPGGPHAGQPIWSCSTYPACRGTIVIDLDAPESATHRPRTPTGASAHSIVDVLKRWWTDRIR